MSTGEPKSTILHRTRPLLVARAIRKRFAGVRALDAIAHPRLSFSANDRAAGISPAPVILYTGTYTVTRETVDLFLPGVPPR
jgi:hypothetical protein